MQNKHYTSKTANKKMFVAKHRLPLHTNDCVYPFLKLLILCAPARKCAEHRWTAKPANTYEEMKKQYLQLLSLVSLPSNMYINILYQSRWFYKMNHLNFLSPDCSTMSCFQ